MSELLIGAHTHTHIYTYKYDFLFSNATVRAVDGVGDVDAMICN